MSKDKISQYSTTNALNTDIGGINIDENCLPSNLNDSVREVMVQLKEFQDGSSNDSFTSSNLIVTGGSISGITDLAVADGGTGASNATNARTNLGLGTIATQNANAAAITGGSVNGTTVGALTASTGAFTTLLASGTSTLAAVNSGALAVTGAISSTTGANFATSSGNVGIGTSSPAAKLHVVAASLTAASLTFGNTAGQIFRNENSEIAIGLLNVAPFTLWIQGRNTTNNARDITFQTLGGNVGIGTASPGYQLTLSTDSAAKPSTNTWTISSDERIKDNISLANLERCYEIVKSLPLKRYTWKADAYTLEQVADRGKLGWIAQDVQKVFPKSTPISKFYGVPEDDGFEDVQEQVTLDEERTTESTAIEVVNGIPTQKTTSKTETIKVPQFDDVVVVDEAGEPVMVPQTDKEIAVVDDAGEPVLDDDGKPMMETVKVANKPLMHQVPRMHTVSKAKMKTEEIKDCLSLNSDQIYAAMYGTIQQLIINSELQQALIESLTTRITALESIV